MQASILQRILVIIFLVGAVVLGVVVASGFLILALLLVPVFLIRFWLHKKQLEKVVRAQQAQYRASQRSKPTGQRADSDTSFGRSSEPQRSRYQDAGSTSGGATIEGEVLKKSEEHPSNSDPNR